MHTLVRAWSHKSDQNQHLQTLPPVYINVREWNLHYHQVRQIRTIQQCHLGNILKIKWDQYISNEEVLTRAGLEDIEIKLVRKRKMRAMQSRPYCLTNGTMVNVQLVVQRYATKIRIDEFWGVVMSWKTGDQEWTTEGNGGNSPSKHVKRSLRRERKNIKTKVRKREEIVNKESFFLLLLEMFLFRNLLEMYW